MSSVRKAKHGWALTLFFSILSIIYVILLAIIVAYYVFPKKNNSSTFSRCKMTPRVDS